MHGVKANEDKSDDLNKNASYLWVDLNDRHEPNGMADLVRTKSRFHE